MHNFFKLKMFETEFVKKIIESINSEKVAEVDTYLKDFFNDLIDRYDFYHIHNKIYSRELDVVYAEDCRNIHLLKSFDYYFKDKVKNNIKKFHPELLYELKFVVSYLL